MFSRLFKIFILVLVTSFAFMPNETVASSKKAEGGEGEKKAEGGEKKAEGEEKKAEGGEGEKKAEKKDEYAEVQAKVAALEAKIRASEEIIKKLVEEKHSEKDQKKISEIIKSLVAEHKTMQKNNEEYEQAKSYLRYRFPEKGLKGEREYERIEVKSLEEIENELTLESKLKKTLGKVRKQYVAPDPKPKKMDENGEVVEQESHSSKSGKRTKKQGPSISDPVILTK